MQRNALLSHLLRKEEGSDTEGVSVTMDIKESDVEEKTSRSEFEVEEESKDSLRKEDVPVEEPKDLGETEEEESSDVEEEKSKDTEEEEKPLDWAEEVKKEATKKLAEEEEEDLLKVMEGWRREEVATKKWQELKPRTVRTVEAHARLEDEAELFFEPGALITGVRPASWIKDDGAAVWLEGTLDERVGLVLECCVKYLPDQSD